MLSHSTFHLEDLCKKKTALYIVTDDTTTTADSIVGIIISQIQTFLVENAYNNGGKLDTRFNFIMDEFASFAIQIWIRHWQLIEAVESDIIFVCRP